MSKIQKVLAVTLTGGLLLSVAACSDSNKKAIKADCGVVVTPTKGAADLPPDAKGATPSATAVASAAVSAPPNNGCTTPSPSASPSPTASAQAATGVVDQLNLICPKCNVGTPNSVLAVGSQVKTDAKHHTPVRGTNSFSLKTLTTPKEVGEFLRSNTVKGRQAHDRVVKAIKAAGYGQDEINRALSGDGYFAIQMVLPSQIQGTSYSVGGKTYVEVHDWRTVPAGDILWLYLTKDNKIIKGAAVRADCGNPNVISIRPITPNTPPAPPVSCVDTKSKSCKPVKCIYGTYNPKTGLCSKDPKQDPQSKGNVPTQATENHPSVDNPTEASRSPEPISTTGNQIPAGSTPRATPSPAPTHSGPTTVPQPSSSPAHDPGNDATPTAPAGGVSPPPPPPPG